MVGMDSYRSNYILNPYGRIRDVGCTYSLFIKNVHHLIGWVDMKKWLEKK